MTTPAQVTPLAIEDYDAIEAAVMETQRGRWFLAEYARRNRNTDTDAVLTTLERIERAIRRDRAAPDIDRIRLDLADMAEAISRTKQEIAQMKLDTAHGGRFADASHELDAIVGQTETATNEILLAAEGIQEAAWTLREAGASDELCDKLDAAATEIYTACSFQDLTGQRTRKVVTVLRYLESRINAMMDIWGLEDADDLDPATPSAADPMDQRPDAHLLNGPQLHGRGLGQDSIDDLMWGDPAAPETVDVGPVVEAEIVEAEIVEADASEGAETAADVFAATDEPEAFDPATAEADVFASDVDGFARPAAGVVEEEMPVEEPGWTTVTVGATVAVVAAETVAVESPARALAVVTAVDPIAALEPAERIVTFG